MDGIENRLDRFLSTNDFDGLGLKWGYDSFLYHYSRDTYLSNMQRDLKVTNLSRNIMNAELASGLDYLRRKAFSIDREIWHAALEGLSGEGPELDVSRYWTFSLCREKRSEFMWNNYSQKGDAGKPCVMEFDGGKIYERIQAMIAEDLRDGYLPNGSLHFFLPCFYQPYDDEKIGRLADFITGGDYYGCLCRRSKGCEVLKNEDKLILARDLSVMFALMIKGRGNYLDEKEPRLILIGDQSTDGYLRSVGLGFNPIVSVRHSL